MRSIFFDTGPIISFATNNLLDVFGSLKKAFDGEFYITNAVKNEIIERPLESKRYKFEALQVLKQYQDGVFKLYKSDKLAERTEELLFLANNSFKVSGKYVPIVHYAEMEVIAAAIELEADAIIIDERTTRMLVENPTKVKERLERKLHTQVEINKEHLFALKSIMQKINVLRSFELITVAYEKGFLNGYIINSVKEPKRELLEGVLWGVKLSGCSVSEDEINQIISIEKTR